MPAAVLSLGSNLGSRAENLRGAVVHLDPAIIPGSLRLASLYETEPIGCPPGSPPFLNTVIEFETELTPEQLLERTQSIEAELGRPLNRELNAPRPVDLDILLYDDLEIATSRLTIPHPRMMERAFVLCPLSELRSEFAEAAAKSDQSGVSRLLRPLFSE